MLGQKTRIYKVHSALSLEALVPKNHFYRQLDAKLDLSFVRELVAASYSVRLGRPSIDPVVFSSFSSLCFSRASAPSASSWRR